MLTIGANNQSTIGHNIYIHVNVCIHLLLLVLFKHIYISCQQFTFDTSI